MYLLAEYWLDEGRWLGEAASDELAPDDMPF